MLKNINIPKRNINLNKDFLKFNLYITQISFRKIKSSLYSKTNICRYKLMLIKFMNCLKEYKVN